LFLAVGIGLAIWFAQRAVAIFASLVLAINVAFLWPCIAGSVPAARTPTNGGSFAIVHANLGLQAEVPKGLVDLIEATDPDIVFLQEVTPNAADQLESSFPTFSVIQSCPRSDSRGVAALASRQPVRGFSVISSTIARLAANVTDRPHVTMQVAVQGTRCQIISFHCKRPSSSETIAIQQAEYVALAEWFQSNRKNAALAIGDFNSTPWSKPVRELIVNAHMPSIQSGLGIGPTWPAGRFQSLGIPIDLCIHNAGVATVSMTGAPVGSDHLPLYCRVYVDQQTR
jgi:endonuclease/exonuclease/phosphatase (EEP) superfamily protein YafD